jgi:hypothetical protein
MIAYRGTMVELRLPVYVAASEVLCVGVYFDRTMW